MPEGFAWRLDGASLAGFQRGVEPGSSLDHPVACPSLQAAARGMGLGLGSPLVGLLPDAFEEASAWCAWVLFGSEDKVGAGGTRSFWEAEFVDACWPVGCALAALELPARDV